MGLSEAQQTKVLCDTCTLPTTHLVLKDYEFIEKIDEGDGCFYPLEHLYEIVQCCGCESISFRYRNWFSEHWDGDSGPPLPSREVLYPVRPREILKCKEQLSLSPELQRIYRETREAFNSGLFTLCAAGIRAILEGICSDKGVKSGPVQIQEAGGLVRMQEKENLQGRIQGLAQRNFLLSEHARILHNIRFLGNEALHRLTEPEPDNLIAAFKVLDHTLTGLYELNELGKRIFRS